MEDRVAESHEILLDAWQALGHANPSFQRRRGGLIEIAWNGFSNVFFNLAVTARAPASIEEFDTALRDTCAWAAGRHAPWMFCACRETLGPFFPQAERLLAQLGFAPMMTLTGMEAGELNPPIREVPAGTWLTEAEPSIADHTIRLNEAAYQIPIAEPGSLPLYAPGWWTAPGRMSTVLVTDGRPVSCAALLSVGGIRYVALVATAPDARQRGYAEASMRNVLSRSLVAGLNQRTYLHATGAGRPIYERMGYKTTAEYAIYALGH